MNKNLSSNREEKPPLGITPKSIYYKQREVDILNAMQRYSEANLSIPMEWIEELRELQGI